MFIHIDLPILRSANNWATYLEMCRLPFYFAIVLLWVFQVRYDLPLS